MNKKKINKASSIKHKSENLQSTNNPKLSTLVNVLSYFQSLQWQTEMFSPDRTPNPDDSSATSLRYCSFTSVTVCVLISPEEQLLKTDPRNKS